MLIYNIFYTNQTSILLFWINSRMWLILLLRKRRLIHHFVIFLYLTNEQSDYMFNSNRQLLNPTKILQSNHRFLKFRLCNFSADHSQINHQQHFKQRIIRNMNMWYSFNGNISLFLFNGFIGAFLNKFQADIGPVIGYVIALKHHDVGVVDC